jgi:hypothetical protein
VLAQQPKQAVGRGVEQQPELIGPEAMATQAIGLDLQLQFLDAVFRLQFLMASADADKQTISQFSQEIR